MFFLSTINNIHSKNITEVRIRKVHNITREEKDRTNPTFEKSSKSIFQDYTKKKELEIYEKKQ